MNQKNNFSSVRLLKPYLFVEVEKHEENTITYGSLELYLDSSFNKLENKRIYGTVVQVPERLPNIDWDFDKSGRKYSDISPEIRVGDKVYFYYRANSEDSLVDAIKESKTDTRKIIKVDYSRAICVVRDGVIIPVCGAVLLEPVKEKVKTILHTPDMGNKEKSIGIIRYVDIMNDSLYNLELKTYPELYPNKEVVFKPIAGLKQVIEGVEYYVMKYYHIIAYPVLGSFMPVPNHVIVKSYKQGDIQKKGKLFLIAKHAKKTGYPEGEVLQSSIGEINRGDIILFKRLTQNILKSDDEFDYFSIPEKDILCKVEVENL